VYAAVHRLIVVLVVLYVSFDFYSNGRNLEVNYLAVCTPACQHGGTCSSPGVCSCASGWSGTRCASAICTPACSNGGGCSSPGVCSCVGGWGGTRCTVGMFVKKRDKYQNRKSIYVLFSKL